MSSPLHMHSSLSLLQILSIRYLLYKFCHRSIRSRCASATKTYPFVRFSLESCGKNPLIVRPNSISFSKMCQQSAKLFSFKVFKVNLPLPSSDPQDTWRIYSSHSCETLTGFSKTRLPSLSRNRIRQWSNAGTMKWKKHWKNTFQKSQLTMLLCNQTAQFWIVGLWAFQNVAAWLHRPTTSQEPFC